MINYFDDQNDLTNPNWSNQKAKQTKQTKPALPKFIQTENQKSTMKFALFSAVVMSVVATARGTTVSEIYSSESMNSEQHL